MPGNDRFPVAIRQVANRREQVQAWWPPCEPWVLVITRQPAHALGYARHAIVMKNGAVIASGPPPEC